MARQKWEMLQGLPEVLEVFVTVCALCPFYLFKTTTSNHFTITNKKPEDVGVSEQGEMVAQRTGGICPVTAEPIAPGHLPFMQATQQLLPPRWPEGKSQLLTATLMQQAH